MEDHIINIVLPKGSDFYIFGSSLLHDDADDLDILILYDTAICSPKYAYEYHNGLLNQIKLKCKKKIDVTFLSYQEEKQLNFINTERAIHYKCLDLFIE